MTDEIIQELWRIKDAIASEHGYDLDALAAHLRRIGSSSGQRVNRSSSKGIAEPGERANDPEAPPGVRP